MNQQDKKEPNNQQSVIEDLTVNENQAAAVKGGRFIGVGELQECTITKVNA